MDLAASIALGRFGLGPSTEPSPGTRDDPRDWLNRQVGPVPTPAALAAFPSSADTLRALHAASRSDEDKKTLRKQAHQTFAAEVVALANHRVATDAPFAERMVMFWSNHFCVSRTKVGVGPAIPAFEREVIRPHVFGRFEDMLQAATAHPVMLDYLDNHLSVGPNSRAGRRTGRSLNENLAREILELHTLGVNGGYTQDDVRSFAAVLTGWTHDGVQRKRSPEPVTGRFVFRERMHEPGAKRVLGQRFADAGVEQGRAVLHALAGHPSTATFVATKLVRHFVSDAPAADDVEAVAAVFRETGGDLAAVSRALVALPSVWETPLPKVKSPYELVISTFRAIGFTKVRQTNLLVPLETMGQEPYHAPSPQGWPDTAGHWLGPEALERRIEWVRAMATRSRVTPMGLLERFEPLVPASLRTWMTRAPSGDDAIALFLASPTFQRR